MLSRLPANDFFLLVNMTRKCHNHRLLTDPLHLKKGTRNTDIYNIIKVKQPALFFVNMNKKQIRKQRPGTKLPQPKGTTTNKVSNIHTSFQKLLDVLS